MALNDKLKGAYYRTPLTKLASRSTIINQFNELIDYFNSLNELLSGIFNEVTKTREYAIGLLLKMEATIAHFKYIKDQYQNELDAHIQERLAALIESFTNSFNNILEKYNVNMFNHSTISDDYGSNSTKNEANNLEEWDKSVSMNASDLGIRWFGGKFSDKHVVSEINNLFHLIKINTADGKINEDVINSNPILELFVKTPKGISWLVLGQNGSLGYNMIVKYQSGELINNIKIMSENYYTPKKYEINNFDLNLFITTLLDTKDVNGSNVYIKVKTNLPSNTESGREGYFVSTSAKTNTFDDFYESREIVNAANKLMYEDNKDLQILKRDDISLSDMTKTENTIKVETEEVINPVLSKEFHGSNTQSSENNAYYAELNNRFETNNEVSFANVTKNHEDKTMNSMQDTISGRVTHHQNVVNTKNRFYEDDFDNANKEYDEDSKPKYFKGQQIEDLFDYRNVGRVQLLAKNEHMFEIDGTISNKHPVIHNDKTYAANKSDNTVVNRLYNNALFDTFDDDKYIERKFRILHKDEKDFEINCIVKTKLLGVLIGTTKGVYILEGNKGFVSPVNTNVKCILEFGNTVYVGTTGKGIYYWDTSTKSFKETNVIGGNIAVLVIAPRPDNSKVNTVYAFKSDCTYATKTELGQYDLDKFYYCLFTKDGSDVSKSWYNEQELGTKHLNNNTAAYRVDLEEVAKGITASNGNNTQDYKIVYNEVLKRWYILNKESGFVAMTRNEKLMYFRKSDIYEKFGSVVDDIAYEDGSMYISVKDNSNLNEDELEEEEEEKQEEVEVPGTDNGEE